LQQVINERISQMDVRTGATNFSASGVNGRNNDLILIKSAEVAGSRA
jgi:hypothetical protein